MTDTPPPILLDEPRPTWRARLVQLIPLAVVLMFGLTMRLHEFFQPLIDDFSWRQASTAMMADNFYRESRNIFYPAVNWNGPQPSYQGREFQTVSYLAALLYEVVGQKDWVGRGISVVFSVWGIAALYFLTRRVWDEARAIAVALMYAILPGAVVIDRSFLPDGTMLGLTLTTAWFYVAHLQTGRMLWLVGAGIVGVLAYLTKLPGVVSLAALIYATVAILRKRDALHWPALTPILITLGLMLLPIAAYYAWAVYLGRNTHVAGAANWVWKDGIGTWIGRGYYLRETWDNARWWLWTPPFILLGGLGLLCGPGRRRIEFSASRDATPTTSAGLDAPWFFHFWLVGCLVLYAIGARELRENVWNYHVFNVFAAAMAGQGLVVIATFATEHRPRWEAVVRIMIVLGLALWWSTWAVDTMYRPPKVASWQMGRALERISEPGDLVVTIAEDVGDPISIYYSHRRGWTFPPAHRQALWKPWNLMPPAEIGIEMFEDLRGQGAKWLGIVNRPKDDAPDESKKEFWHNHPEIVAHINETCEHVESNEFYVLYRIRTPEEIAAMPPPSTRQAEISTDPTLTGTP